MKIPIGRKRIVINNNPLNSNRIVEGWIECFPDCNGSIHAIGSPLRPLVFGLWNEICSYNLIFINNNNIKNLGLT